MAKEKEMPEEQAQESEKKEFKEVTVKFGKGLVGEPFQGKDGNEYCSIKIPNRDENDKSPWASFVVKANAVHEDQFGKGMWIKLPAEGSTTVSKPKITGQDEQGKNIYETEKTKIPNKELKGMVEFYKQRPREQEESREDKVEDKKPSLKQKMEEKKEKVEETKKTKSQQKSQEKTQSKAKSKSGNEL